MLINHLYSLKNEERSSAHDERYPYRPAYFFGRHRGLHRPDGSALRRGAFRLRGSRKPGHYPNRYAVSVA